MNTKQVHQLLLANRNERGVDNWNKIDDTGGLKSYGIGLTLLRKLAKQIGRNHQLAKELWASEYYDAKVISLLIDEPNLITREQAERQVEELNAGMLRHVFSSCDATLSKTSFVVELSQKWIISKDKTRRSCGYGLLYELSKNNRNKSLTDQLFLDVITRIDATIDSEANQVRLAMAGALMGIGKRNTLLNKAAIKVAERVGKVSYADGKNKCEPIDVMKHLTSDYLTKKLSQ